MYSCLTDSMVVNCLNGSEMYVGVEEDLEKMDLNES